MAIIDNALVILYDLTAIFMTQYDLPIHDQFRFYEKALTWVRPAEGKMTSNEYEVTLRHKPARDARGSVDPLADFTTPANTIGLDTYTVWMKASTDAASNDMRRIDGSTRITQIDLDQAAEATGSVGDGKKADIVMTMRRDLLQSMAFYRASHQFLPTSGVMATIDGDPVQNDDIHYSGGTAHTNQSSCRAKIAGPIAMFSEGMTVHVHPTGNSTARQFGGEEDVVVTGVNPVDNSIGLTGSGDMAAAVDTDEIVLSDNYDKNFIGFGAWMSDPTSTIYSKDRSAAAGMYLQPVDLNANNAQFDMPWLNHAARSIGYVEQGQNAPGFVNLTTPEIVDRFIAVVGQDALISVPSVAQGGDLVAHYGFDGLMYHHPMLGRLALEPMLYAPANTIWLIRPSNWRHLYIANRGLNFMPGQVAGIWNNVTSSGRRSMFWEATAYDFCAYVNYWPRGECLIRNIIGEESPIA